MARAIRTFLDSGVLITAFKGAPALRERALQVLEDPDREFLSSPYVRFEVLPKAIFNKQVSERHFYEQYFAQAESAADLALIFDLAEREVSRSGTGTMDALHLAAAHLMKADEFVTTEKPGKSVYRTSLVKVIYLFS